MGRVTYRKKNGFHKRENADSEKEMSTPKNTGQEDEDVINCGKSSPKQLD